MTTPAPIFASAAGHVCAGCEKDAGWGLKWLPCMAIYVNVLHVTMEIMRMAEISAETMRDLIDYNPETGRLLWKERPVSLFTEKRHAATWNKRFAGRDALSARDKAGYLQGMVMRAPIKAHRAAWAIFHGEWPKLHIDHINGDRSDNRISNLREVTVSENLRNRRPNKFRKSGLPPGVVMARNGRFYAQVKTSAGRVMSSTFDTAMEAGAEYLNLCSEHGFHENHGKPLSEIAQDADQ